ncbi:prepilin-type N-terminal cleavage/methylation domain-containing protein [Halobacillus litoralis]|uniref:prepilin-type N-terminal cleavage/methylation domain-containing protein n=1 Tax=Halobacillus litoralis TaxID=45668 RepID=UPI001CFDC0E6|nr:prepilin-type N-terminal cleavage/methylation domain-containing protein [Halobacillus litoralis]
MKKLRELLKNEKGFTLVELLAVIVILGIIAAIAVPAIGGIIGDTKEDAHNANALSLLESARLAYASGEDVATITGSDGSGYTAEKLVNKGYLDVAPQNPETNSDYSSAYVVVVDSVDKVEYKVTLGSDISNKTKADLSGSNTDTDDTSSGSQESGEIVQN